MANAWVDGESPLVDERQFTPWAESGWKSWNPFSPEEWFCDVAGQLASRGGIVIETGVGQGYITRRAAWLADVYLAYESAPHLRSKIPSDFTVIDDPTPDQSEIEICSLLIVDSGLSFRKQELKLWWEQAPDDSLLWMHDAGNGHEQHGDGYTHLQYWRIVRDLGIPGIRFKNPRGAFLGWKTEPDDLDQLAELGPHELPYY